MRMAFRIGHPTDTIDKIIRFFTKKDCYHCELVFSDGVSFSSDPQSNGTRFKKIDYTDTNEWELICIPWINKKQETRIREFCTKELGCKYDWLAVLLGWLVTPANSENRWYCCEICLEAIKAYSKTLTKDWYNPFQLREGIRNENFWRKTLV